MRKVKLFLSVIFLFPFLVSAQDVVVNNDTVVARNTAVKNYKNLAKINSIALLLNNVSLMYERQLNEHWTVLAAGGYRWEVRPRKSLDRAMWLSAKNQ